MTFAAPLFVWVAAVAAAVTVALHLLAWRRPPETPLPTARFAPDAPVRTVSRALRLADLALLGLRVALVLLAGAALGRPTMHSRAAVAGHGLVVDQSRGARGNAAVADSARARFAPADLLVVFDSTAREVIRPSRDSIGNTAGPRVAASLSAGLVAAIRAAQRLERERDSVEIVIVSPFDADELDAATASIRQQWHGSVRLVRVVPPNDSRPVGRVVVRAPAGDALAAALALSSQIRSGGDVRVMGDVPTAADSAWARQGHTVVVWPATATLEGWPTRTNPDTAFAVSAMGPARSSVAGSAGATVVAALPRAMAPPPGRVVARWQDGEPAATEHTLGGGCIRAVAVPVPAAGDLSLTPAFRRFAERLTIPCGSAVEAVPVPDRVLATVLPAASPSRASATTSTGNADTPAARVTAWLLALAMVAAVAELAVRRGATNATA